MRPLAVLWLCCFPLFVGLAQEPARQPATLTIDEVLKLVRAGVSEELIVAKIKHYNKPFDLNADEILELKKSGVSETILKFLEDPSLPYNPAPPPTPAAPPPVRIPGVPPKDPASVKVPPEPAIYWMATATPGHETFTALEFRPVVPFKQAGKIGSMIPLKKKHTGGFLVGQKSKLRTKPGTPVFYARLGPKASVEDLVLLRMEKGDERRELDLGPKPDKPAFPPDSVRQFESKEASEGLFRITPSVLEPGEYIFLILGSGDEKKGVLGKGYDFGVDPK